MSDRRRSPRQPLVSPPAEDALSGLDSPAAIDALLEAGADLLKPSNRSPRQLVQDLIEGQQDWQALERHDVTVRHSLEHGLSKIELVLSDDRNLPGAIELTSIMARRCKWRLIRLPDRHDASQFADRSQYQPPRHTHYAKPGVVVERRRSKRRA